MDDRGPLERAWQVLGAINWCFSEELLGTIIGFLEEKVLCHHWLLGKMSGVSGRFRAQLAGGFGYPQ